MARKLFPLGIIFASVVFATLTVGCGIGPGETGSFDKSFSVTGPVQLERSEEHTSELQSLV